MSEVGNRRSFFEKISPSKSAAAAVGTSLARSNGLQAVLTEFWSLLIVANGTSETTPNDSPARERHPGDRFVRSTLVFAVSAESIHANA